jgi:hypothetical protein
MRNFRYEKAYRQGEVLIFKLPKKMYGSVPTYSLERQPDNVIREGEESGHEHKVVGDAQLSLFKNDKDEGVIDVGKEGAKITHPEHKDIDLKPGKYVVKTQKEAKGKHGGQSVKD